MPIMTGVQGYTGLTQQVRLCLEPTSGEQVLMPQTSGASTMSLTTQPNTLSPTTGMHLHFFVIGNAASGTIQIAGTSPSGGNITSQTYHVNPAPQNSQGYSEFTTKEAFATVTSSGITTTGITPCQVLVFGSYAAKFLVPITADAEEKISHFSPQDRRGILAKNFRVSQLTKDVSLDKFDATLYPDSLWAPYMLFGNSPNVTTIPATPTVLFAAATKASTMTLTTAPSSPGQFLIFTIASNTTAGTITLSGKDNYGYTATETINVTSGQTTAYSTRRYSALTSPGTNQFTTTGFDAGATIAVAGVFAWQYSWTYDGVNSYTQYSATLEVFNGVYGYVMPYTHFSDGTFTWSKEKEIQFSAKGAAQDYAIVGDPTSTSAGTNPFTTLSQPTSLPMVSWPASFFIDNGTGTALTTQDGTFEDFKLQVMTGRKSFYSGDGQQRWSNVTWDSEPDFSVDATVILSNYQNYANFFKPNQSLILGVSFQGTFLGNNNGTNVYESVTFTLPVKADVWKNDMSKNPVQATIKFMAEYSLANLGYYYRCSWVSATPPVYTA
jgi:hypothetical protein